MLTTILTLAIVLSMSAFAVNDIVPANMLIENESRTAYPSNDFSGLPTRAQYVLTTYFTMSVSQLGSNLMLTTMNANKYFTKSQVSASHVMISGSSFSYSSTSGLIKIGFATYNSNTGYFTSKGYASIDTSTSTSSAFAAIRKTNINAGDTEPLYGYVKNTSNGTITGGNACFCDYMNT